MGLSADTNINHFILKEENETTPTITFIKPYLPCSFKN